LIKELKTDLGVESINYAVEPKFDGLAIALIYEEVFSLSARHEVMASRAKM
jgi:NAD-dependent DNA ligase